MRFEIKFSLPVTQKLLNPGPGLFDIIDQEEFRFDGIKRVRHFDNQFFPFLISEK